MLEEEWNFVGRNGKVRPLKTQTRHDSSISYQDKELHVTTKQAKRMINHKLVDLRQSDFTQEAKLLILSQFDQLLANHPPEGNQIIEKLPLVCYGIGSIYRSEIAQYQLAFLLLLIEWFSTRATDLKTQLHVEIFDPILTVSENQFLQQLGIKVIEVNEMCRRRVCDTWGIFFMPHCERFMYCNLLMANLDTKTTGPLSRVLLVGNSFTRYDQDTMSKSKRKEINAILSLLPFIVETSLPKFKTDASVFNDLSIHRFLL